MASQQVAFLIARRAITKTHSRPHASDHNPFSESQFKTLKYGPEFPERFGSIKDATTFYWRFFSWSNHDHHHSGIGLMTPAMVHGDEVEAVTQVRKLTLSAALEGHLERFVRGTPRPPVAPEAAGIKKPKTNSSVYEACALAENTLTPRVWGDESMRDRRPWGILEADFFDPAPRPPVNDTKFVREVSQNHGHVPLSCLAFQGTHERCCPFSELR